MKLYLAGPLGFSEAGRAFQYQVLIPRFAELGFQVLDPWRLTDAHEISQVNSLPYGAKKKHAWRELNQKIALNNTRAIDGCDFVVAVLDGPDVDSGTAAEIGYAFAKGKRILGYRSDFRMSGDNEGTTVNLQVEFFILKSGGRVCRDLEELIGAVGCRADNLS